MLFFAMLTIIPSILAAQEENANRHFHQRAYENHYKTKLEIEKAVSEMMSGTPLEIEGEYVFSQVVLPEFYANRDFMPAWHNWGALMDAIGALGESYRDGLAPNDYHAEALTKIIDRIEEKLKADTIDYNWVAEFDILVTDAVLMYAYHLIAGKVDPESMNPNWNYSFREISPDAPDKLERYIESATVSCGLEELRPQNPAYKMYMDLLAAYRVIANNGGWGAIEEYGVVKSGNEDERIPAIRQRLRITNELSTDTNMNSMVYDEVLESDIKQFQNRNALTPDGVIGKGTLEALNISVEEMINKLRVNMERNRWVMASMSEDYIIVNIAAFKAYYMKEHELVFSTNVQVGKTYHQTPVFRKRLSYIEFNPTWTVPVSIVRSSVIPKMKNDPDYLNSRHFELLDAAGNVISNNAVDYENLSSSNFPYTVRQKPGPWNALGIVKFIFPNKHSIYLHDTPSKSFFVKQDRTFSHGCVRTQYPLDLAEVILQGSEWTRDRIDATIESKKTTRVFPDHDIDILLMYWTAGFYDGNGIGFFKDVYDRDQKVLEQLNKKDTWKAKKGGL